MFFKHLSFSALVLGSLVLSACTSAATEAPQVSTQAGETNLAQLTDDIAIDGSSTVYPITEAAAEEFGAVAPNVRVAVGIAGTGGGFKKFCNGETDISNASRAIKTEEKEACAAAGIEYTEFKIGLDGLSVVVNPNNDWVTCLTTEQLKKIWDVDSPIKSWQEIDPAFPDQPLALYGPGTDSGTFDFFTEVINGEAKQSRSDYTASEDDNVLVQGIEGDANALGYFGMAYYLENAEKLKAVQVDSGAGCIMPSFETVADGSYKPLSRPLYFYVNNASVTRPAVYEFVKFYLTNAPQLVTETDYVPVEQSIYDADLATLAALHK